VGLPCPSKVASDVWLVPLESAKVLWLKKHMPKEAFDQSMFFDLPDFLTFLATGDLARSNCSLACKCSYVPPGVEGSKGWNDDFFKKIGLEEFVRCALNSFWMIVNLK
jgi:ribulose kinase